MRPHLLAVLPEGVDDPRQPSGGNVYDRRVCDGLRAVGWPVEERTVPGRWPRPGARERRELAAALAAVPPGTPVLVDGLLASAAPDAVVPAARRLPVTVLVHLPLGVDAGDEVAAREQVVLEAAAAVVVTSTWCRAWLLDRYGLAADRVVAAVPGADRAPLAPGSTEGTALLCVATVAQHKGHDLLAEALAQVADLPWRCTCVGDLGREPAFVAGVQARLAAAGLGPRVRLTGALPPQEVADAYDRADLLLLPSRLETYGMVLTEALARGVPVLAARVGGIPDTAGRAADGTVPGLLVPPDDPGALAAALRRWCTDPRLRARLRGAAVARRDDLPPWSGTVQAVDRAVEATLGVRV